MKKSLLLISLAMVAALALCLVGCGGSESAASSQSKIDSAVEFNYEEVEQAEESNEARAEVDYVGKYFKVTGKIRETEKDGIIVATKEGSYNPVLAKMPTEEVAKLNKGQEISFVGKLDKISGERGFITFKEITLI